MSIRYPVPPPSRRISAPKNLSGGYNTPLTTSGSDVTIALTGSISTISAGSLTLSHSNGIAGTAATSSAGTLAVSRSKALAGTAATSSAGTFIPATTLGISGTSVTVSSGTVTTGSDLTLALTGEAVSGLSGDLASQRSNSITGTSVSASAGTLGITNAPTLTSVVVSSSGGAFSITHTGILSGEEVAVLAGTLTIPGNATISMAFYHQSDSGVVQTGGSSVTNDISLSVSSGFPGTDNYPVIGHGVLQTTSAGTAQLRFRSEDGGIVTAKEGFTLIVERLS